MRPSKLNEELIDRMKVEIEQGLPINYTCDLLCITQPSYNSWMNQGEQDIKDGKDTIHALLFMTIKKAQAEFIKTSLKEIRKGEQGWQAKSWRLERTRQDFMPRQRVEANTEDGKVNVIIGGKVKEVKRDNNKQ